MHGTGPVGLDLFCFPHAGASATVYARWRRRLPEWLQVRPVELPGRGARIQELPYTDLDALADLLAGELIPQIGRPYALFGHSLGALLAFEVAHRLTSCRAAGPQALFVSGTHAPTRRNAGRYASWQSDDALVAEMRKLQGTSPEVLASTELMALTLPVLRADFQVCGGYRPKARPPLQCPLHVFGGDADETTWDTLMAWQYESAGTFSLDVLQGGHFFIRSCEARVLELICGYLESGLS
jgi:surfactin synthase thioesterase subunit